MEFGPTWAYPSSHMQNKIFSRFIADFIERRFVIHFNLVIGRRDRHDEVNLLTPNDDYSGRTASLTSKCCILYIYSTNIGTEYFKHGIYSPFFPLQSAVCFIILIYLVPVLFTFYIQDVLKLKKNNSGAKRLIVFIILHSNIVTRHK